MRGGKYGDPTSKRNKGIAIRFYAGAAIVVLKPPNLMRKSKRAKKSDHKRIDENKKKDARLEKDMSTSFNDSELLAIGTVCVSSETLPQRSGTTLTVAVDLAEDVKSKQNKTHIGLSAHRKCSSRN